jgi:hypothetical protein
MAWTWSRAAWCRTDREGNRHERRHRGIRAPGLGADLQPEAPFGLLILDLVNGFADPAVFGGGNIPEAIPNTERLLAAARERGWPVAHSRIAFSDSGAGHNIFTLKVPGMLTLKEAGWNSAIVPQLAPQDDEPVVRKTVPSAFFGTALAAWLTQRGVKRCWTRGASPAAACGPAWSMRCRWVSGHWWSRTASATARRDRTRPTCSTCARSTRR